MNNWWKIAWFVMALAARCDAQALEWENGGHKVSVPFGQTSADADVLFKNVSAHVIVIELVTPSCGCTTATFGRDPVEPGGVGRIHTRTELRGRTGTFAIALAVKMKDMNQPEGTLLEITPDPPFTVDNRVVRWANGEALDPKEVIITPAQDHVIRIEKVHSSSPTVIATLKEDREDGSYRIDVRPQKSLFPTRAVITIDVVVDGEVRVKHEIYGFLNESGLR